MFVVRVLVLMFLVFYGWEMGQTPESGLNGFGKFISMSFFFTAPALYLLPTYEAWKNQHPNLTAIALVNVFLGWSVLGWVGALVWAFKKPEPTLIHTAALASGQVPSTWSTTVVRPDVSAPAAMAVPVRATKTCKFCAEEILAAAIKCKHCGSDVVA